MAFGTMEFTILIAIVIGSITFMIGWFKPFPVLASVLLLLAFKDFISRWLNAFTDLPPELVIAVSRIWLIILLALAAAVAVHWSQRWFQTRTLPRVKAFDVVLIILFLIGIAGTVTSEYRGLAFTSFRGYFQPLLVFVLARAIKPTRKELKTLLILLLIVGAVMATVEIWQAFGWTEADYKARGYQRQSGELVTPVIEAFGGSYIRPASTVSGPNELGVDMLLLFLIAAQWVIFARFPGRIILGICSVLFLVGLSLTFSRSAFLGLIAAIISLGMLYLFRSDAVSRFTGSKRKGWIILAGVLVVAMFMVILSLIGVVDLIGNTLQTLSAEYHFIDTIDAIEYLASHPAGDGMGLVKPKGALIFLDIDGIYHVEGSLLQIGVEMGILGLALWFIFFGLALSDIWMRWKGLEDPLTKIVSGTAFAGWIGALVAFIFLPLMQSISLMVWLWFFLGMGVAGAGIEKSWQLGKNAVQSTVSFDVLE